LPDGEFFWPDGGDSDGDGNNENAFLGWTIKGIDLPDEDKVVRDRNQYKASGDPIIAVDANLPDNHVYKGLNFFDGTTDTENGAEDDIMHLYALWVPKTSTITYGGGVYDGAYVAHVHGETDPLKTTTYAFDKTQDATVTLNLPNNPYYKLAGWYIYQDENQNANWGYEPLYKAGTTERILANLDYVELQKAQYGQYLASTTDGSLTLPIEKASFGNITLIADYERVYEDLTITVDDINALDTNQSFVLKLDGVTDAQPLYSTDSIKDLKVAVNCNGSGSVTIKHLPVGAYTLTEQLTAEKSNWAWRYADIFNGATGTTVNVVKNPTSEQNKAKDSGNRTNPYWLDGYAYYLKEYLQQPGSNN